MNLLMRVRCAQPTVNNSFNDREAEAGRDRDAVASQHQHAAIVAVAEHAGSVSDSLRPAFRAPELQASANEAGGGAQGESDKSKRVFTAQLAADSFSKYTKSKKKKKRKKKEKENRFSNTSRVGLSFFLLLVIKLIALYSVSFAFTFVGFSFFLFLFDCE